MMLNLPRGGVWIGLKRKSGSGSLYWMNQREVTYTNWNVGQPSSRDAVCVFIR